MRVRFMHQRIDRHAGLTPPVTGLIELEDERVSGTAGAFALAAEKINSDPEVYGLPVAGPVECFEITFRTEPS